jgi:hypothetical protein
VIVVLGRPVAERDRGRIVPAGLAAQVALAAAAAGARVELVGTVADDDTGDALAVALARGRVGHAALLRVPAPAASGDGASAPTRLDARDVDLGLRYLAEMHVLVLAEPLPADVESVALDAVGYHGAAVVALVASGASISHALADTGTVLETPAEPGTAFADLVGRYAAALDAGTDPATAFAEARQASGWEQQPG